MVSDFKDQIRYQQLLILTHSQLRNTPSNHGISKTKTTSRCFNFFGKSGVKDSHMPCSASSSMDPASLRWNLEEFLRVVKMKQGPVGLVGYDSATVYLQQKRSFFSYPLVNVYVTNWKITMLWMGSSTISTGPFSIAMLVSWPFSIANRRKTSCFFETSDLEPPSRHSKRRGWRCRSSSAGICSRSPVGAKESLRFRWCSN